MHRTELENDVNDRVVVEVARVRILPDGRLTREDAAMYLGLKPETLSMWSVDGKGPQHVRVGGRVFYFKEVLDAFVRGETAGD